MALQLNFDRNTIKNTLFMGFSGTKEEQESEDIKRTRRIREMVRDLKRKEKMEGSKPGEDYLSKLTDNSEKEEKYEVEEPVNYNFKEISSKIQSAKTSVRAAEALISAKRKVLEIKRKISSGKGDAEELQLALTHAKRMEMVARKKKHHLELEEMAGYKAKNEEEGDNRESSEVNLKNAFVSAEEEKVSEKEDAVFEERENMLKEETAELKERGTKYSEQMMQKINEMISEFGEEELKELEESMEMLENMEIIDPHMSKEDLKDLKRKHRSDENKAIVKADMDYLKEMIKHMVDKGGAVQVSSNLSGSGIASPAAVPPVPEGICVDIQV